MLVYLGDPFSICFLIGGLLLHDGTRRFWVRWQQWNKKTFYEYLSQLFIWYKELLYCAIGCKEWSATTNWLPSTHQGFRPPGSKRDFSQEGPKGYHQRGNARWNEKDGLNHMLRKLSPLPASILFALLPRYTGIFTTMTIIIIKSRMGLKAYGSENILAAI